MPQTPHEFIDGLFHWIITVNIAVSYALFTPIQSVQNSVTLVMMNPQQLLEGHDRVFLGRLITLSWNETDSVIFKEILLEHLVTGTCSGNTVFAGFFNQLFKL